MVIMLFSYLRYAPVSSEMLESKYYELSYGSITLAAGYRSYVLTEPLSRGDRTSVMDGIRSVTCDRNAVSSPYGACREQNPVTPGAYPVFPWEVLGSKHIRHPSDPSKSGSPNCALLRLINTKSHLISAK